MIEPHLLVAQARRREAQGGGRSRHAHQRGPPPAPLAAVAALRQPASTARHPLHHNIIRKSGSSKEPNLQWSRVRQTRCKPCASNFRTPPKTHARYRHTTAPYGSVLVHQSRKLPRHAHLAVIVQLNVEPLSSPGLSTHMWPPMASHSFLLMVRPRPLPP